MNDFIFHKQLLFTFAEKNNDYNKIDANKDLGDVCESAYHKLNTEDKIHVDKAIDDLKAGISHRFGDRSAYELLASLGNYLEGDRK